MQEQSGRTPKGDGNEGRTHMHSFHPVFIPQVTELVLSTHRYKAPRPVPGCRGVFLRALHITEVTKHSSLHLPSWDHPCPPQGEQGTTKVSLARNAQRLKLSLLLLHSHFIAESSQTVLAHPSVQSLCRNAHQDHNVIPFYTYSISNNEHLRAYECWQG